MDFDHQLEELGIHTYSSGHFIAEAKRIYYLDRLKSIPVNEDHDLLNELKKEKVFDSRYNKYLLGHEILKVIINRVPHTGISESWLGVIKKIAGDPRISVNHHRYIKWWQHIPENLRAKVRRWLSKPDMKFFLQIMKDYADSSKKPDLERMYPSRKYFLDKLLDNDIIIHTRLYLSKGAVYFLQKNYERPEDRPSHSKIRDNRSIIYAELNNDVHIIEEPIAVICGFTNL